MKTGPVFITTDGSEELEKYHWKSQSGRESAEQVRDTLLPIPAESGPVICMFVGPSANRELVRMVHCKIMNIICSNITWEP